MKKIAQDCALVGLFLLIVAWIAFGAGHLLLMCLGVTPYSHLWWEAQGVLVFLWTIMGVRALVQP